MSEAYYTYRIRIANRERVTVEKLSPQKQNMGQPSGVFGYKDVLKEQIDAMIKQAQADELRNDSQVKALGEALFNALFDPVLRQDFVGLYNQVIYGEKKLLRIELDIDEQALPDVAALPWEFMRLPTEANLGILWVGSAPDLIFSRRRSQWFAPKPIQLDAGEKLRIAVAVAAPSDLGPVQFEKEVEGLEKLVEKHPDQFELLPVLTNANAESLDALLIQDPHILHFIGHGRLHEEGDTIEGQIALVDDIFGEAQWIDADFFAELLNTHRPGIVLLQACEGGMASSSRAFVGVASRVVQQNIPVVVAMQYEVSNMTAVRFSLKFYQEVAAGSPVDRAAQNGRRAIGLATQYKRRDFATPVIFMRVEDGHLFVREGETNRDEVSPTPKPTNNRGTTTPIPLTANVTPLHKLIDQRFSLDDIRQMCRPVGVDFDNLQGPGKRIKAQDLGAYAQRRGRLGVLVNEIAEMDPTLLDELKGNLYLFMESIKAHEVAQLCQELKLDCQALKLDENGLLGYDANPYIRTERMKGLQDHMVQNGRYAELVQAVKIRLPHEDLTTFER